MNRALPTKVAKKPKTEWLCGFHVPLNLIFHSTMKKSFGKNSEKPSHDMGLRPILKYINCGVCYENCEIKPLRTIRKYSKIQKYIDSVGFDTFLPAGEVLRRTRPNAICIPNLAICSQFNT